MRILMLVLATTVAADAVSRFHHVIENNAPVDENLTCSYTIVAEIGGRVLEERFAGVDGGNWRLVTVDGEAPSQDDLDDYAKNVRERARRAHPAEFDMANLARDDTLEIAAENFETITFTFRLKPEDGQDNAKFFEQLQGTLVVRKADFRPASFLIENLAPLSPAPTVKIQEFRQEMTFLVDPELDAPLLAKTHSVFRGRAFIFKTFDEERHVRFSGYDCGLDQFSAS